MQGENKDRVEIGKTHKDRLQLTTDRVQRIELESKSPLVSEKKTKIELGIHNGSSWIERVICLVSEEKTKIELGPTKIELGIHKDRVGLKESSVLSARRKQRSS